MANNLIAQVQQKLTDLGYGPLVVDGATGGQTDAAVRKFQASHGLTVDGVVGPQTLQALGIPVPAQVTLPPTNTPLSPTQAAQALNAGYQQVTGQKPSPEILGLLLGQTALETGNWQKMPNYNFGGMKASMGDPYIQVFNTTEVVNGVTTPMKQTFKAFLTAADGAAAYIHMLNSRPHWWQGLQTATPEGFVTGLTTAPAYFTANPAQYLNGLKSRMQAFFDLARQYAGAVFIQPAMMVEQAATFQKGKPLGALFWVTAGAVGLGAYLVWTQHRAQYRARRT